MLHNEKFKGVEFDSFRKQAVVWELGGYYNLLQIFYNFCRSKHGRGRNLMKFKQFKNPSKIKGFGAVRSRMKAYKTDILQVQMMKSKDI